MKKASIALFVLFSLIYILPLGFRPLAIPDEARYGEIAREMLASNDWVVPRLNGLKYFEKPVFGHWANAAAILVFGENAFALRITSALSVILCALLIFLVVRRSSPEGPASVLASAIFLTSPLVLAIGHISILDSLLSMLLTGAMVCFFFAYMAETGPRKTLFLIFTGVFCGLAFLTKGFLAFAVPVLAVTPFLIWEGRFKELLKVPWIPIITAFLVALPWSLMIHFREGDFWNYFFWTEHVARFLNPEGGQHPEPFWYFLPVLIGGALPWTIQSPAALSRVLRAERKTPLMRFALCWLLFPFLFFSVSSGKLIPYVLPCFPPLAILFAIGLTNYFEAGKKRAFSVSSWVLAVIAGLAGAVILFSGILAPDEMRMYEANEGGKWALAALGAFLWAFLVILSTRIKDYQKKLAFYCVATLAFFFIANFVVPDKAMLIRAPGTLLERNLSRVTPESIVVTNDNVLRAVCWYYKRSDVMLLETFGELGYGLKHDDAGQDRFLTVDAFTKMLQENKGKRPVVLVLNRSYYQQYQSLLPAPLYMDTNGYFVFAVY